jgi:hypothetical protein
VKKQLTEKQLQSFLRTIEFSEKSGKHSTRNLSMVLDQVRFKKIPAKEYISLQGVGEVKSRNEPFFFTLWTSLQEGIGSEGRLKDRMKTRRL